MVIERIRNIPGRVSACAREEKRRIVVATVLAFIAGFIMYMQGELVIYGLPLPVFTGLLYAGIVGPAAFLTCLFLPALRFLIEAVACSRLLLAIAVVNFPEIGREIVSSPLLSASLIVGGAIVLRAGWRRAGPRLIGLGKSLSDRIRQPAFR